MNNKRMHVFCLAAEKGNLRALSIFLTEGKWNPNALYGDVFPLHMAAFGGQTKAVELLVQFGADIHIRTAKGRNAVFAASIGGAADTLRAIVALGGDINTKDADGGSALLGAAAMGHTEAFRVIAELGGDINARTFKSGISALFLAAFDGHLETLKAAIELGGDINCKVNDGRTPVLAALIQGHFECVYWLLEQGAETHHRTVKGNDLRKLANFLRARESNDMRIRSYSRVIDLLDTLGS